MNSLLQGYLEGVGIDTNHGSGFTWTKCPKTWVDESILGEITSIVDDALAYYDFSTDAAGNQVKESIKNMTEGFRALNDLYIRNISVNIRDALILTMKTANIQQFHLIKLHDEQTNREIEIIINAVINEDGEVEVPGKGISVKPIKSGYFTPIYKDYQLQAARKAYEGIWNIWERIKGNDWISSKMVLKKNGINASLVELGKDPATIKNLDKFKADLKQQLNNFYNHQKVLLDAGDSIEFMANNEKNIQYIDMLLTLYYKEISRSFGKPITRLAGVSASGLNATGEGDEKNYNMLLSRIGIHYIEAMAKFFDIPFKKVSEVQISRLQATISMLSMMGEEPNAEIIEKVQQLPL